MGDVIDFGRFMRIKSAIERVLAGSTQGMDASALEDAYELWREEVRLTIPDSLADEFSRIARPLERRAPRAISADLPLFAAQARTRLNGLAGWLQGFLDEAREAAQIEANAEAYAREKLRIENPIGFRGDPGTP